MKRVEVDNLIGKTIIITAILLGIIFGTVWVHNGYGNILKHHATTVVTIVVSVIFVALAVFMVCLGLMKNTKYYLYATGSAIIAIFFMLLKIDYEVKCLLNVMVGGHMIRVYMVAIVIFGLMIIASWIRAIVKIVRN